MSSTRSQRRRRRNLYPASWEGIELVSPYGARTPEELAEIRAHLVRCSPGFGAGQEFLKMRPPRPWDQIPKHWSSRAVHERYPDELYEDRTWAPNWPGDYVAVRLYTSVELEKRRQAFIQRYNRDHYGEIPPHIYAQGMDDSDETLELPDDATGLEVIRLLIAGQPLCRADFWGLGFHPT